MKIEKAMILAAGRGKRMRPLTDHTPKPLLKVANKPLLQYHIEALSNAGITEVVINHAWLGEQIVETFKDGHEFGLCIKYSHEREALETGGGISQALPLLGENPFLVINADIWTEIDLSQLGLPEGKLAHLIMVDNPQQHPDGDFHLENGLIDDLYHPCLTFSGMGIYHPDLFINCPEGKFSLPLLLRKAMEQQLVSGEYFQGPWFDIGTPERLEQLEQLILSGEHSK